MAKAKTSITTENRSGSAADAAAKEQRTEMPLSDLHPFEGHPFKVLDDELMEQTVESIKQIGVVSPLIVRPDPEGGFEILSGHRRLHAAQLAGLETVPVIVKEMDDDAAIIFMVDSNLQRENILPSERAFSYKMKLEAMKHQGQRGDLTSDQVGQKSWAVNQLADDANESKTQVQRFIRLTNLIREILDMVDEKKIAFNPAVELSYLKPSEQKEFLEAMDYAQASPSLSQAQRLKKLSQEGGCTLDAMCEVMNEIKKDELDHVTIKNEVLRKYFPKSYTPKQMQDTIIGDMYMDEVTTDDLRLLLVPISKQSASLYSKMNMLIKCVFYSAEESKIISYNPAASLSAKGGTPKQEKKALTDEQVKILLDTIRGLPPYVFVMIGLYAGLRREEILALRWDCVFLDGATPYISVRRAWRSVNNRPVISTELKTPAAKRDIPIPGKLVECLKEAKEKSKSEYVISDRNGNALAESQFVRVWKYIAVRSTEERCYYTYVNGQKIKHVVKPKLGEHQPNNPKLVYTMDFQVTPHQLRHTYITNLIYASVDPKTVQYLAGHENSKVTMDIYAKVKYNKPAQLHGVINRAIDTSKKD